jgi:hypothetical protein
MAQATPTDPPPFKVVETRPPTRTATAVQVAGIVGIVVCAVLIVIVWIGLGTVGSKVNDLAAGVNAGFNRATDAAATVAGNLDAAAVAAGSIGTDASTLASSVPTPDAVTKLANRLGGFVDGYRDLRVRYGALRENVTGAISSLQNVARFVPGLDVPDQPVDALAGVDAKLQSIDDSITSTWQALQGSDTNAAGTAVAATSARLQTVLTEASAAVGTLNDRLVAAQTRAGAATDQLRTILLIVAVVISLLLIWVLALNLALWQLGRHWKREATEAPASAV